MRTLSQTLAGIGYWIPFASRTAGLGLISTLTGFFTKGRSSQWAMRTWCQSSCEQFRIKLDLTGASVLDELGPCILVSNHMSVLDILVLGSLLRRDYRWVAKRSQFKIPFMGWHLHLSGHIPVDRSKPGNQARLDADCKRAIDDGASVLIFPEGTRSKDGILQPFRKGAFVIAAANQVPIVPIVITGTQGVMEKGDWTIAPTEDRQVRVSFLPPIVSTDPEAARAQAYAAMARRLGELRGELDLDRQPTIREPHEVPLRVPVSMMERDR